MNYSKSEIKKSVINVIVFIKQYKRIPQTVWVGKTNYSIKNFLALTELVNAKKAIEEFKKKNKRLPNYVTIREVQMPKEIYTKLFNITSTSSSQNTTKTTKTNNISSSQTRFVSSPYLLDPKWEKQDYDDSCCLNCLQLAFYKLTGLKITEKEMYQMGYTKDGTSIDGLKAIVKKLNSKYKTNISVETKELKSFGSSVLERWRTIGKLMSKSNVAVFFRLGYTNGGASCSKNDKYHGHYETCDIVNVSTMYVRALNSLSGGYLQDRKINVQECFMNRRSPNVIVLTKK